VNHHTETFRPLAKIEKIVEKPLNEDLSSLNSINTKDFNLHRAELSTTKSNMMTVNSHSGSKLKNNFTQRSNMALDIPKSQKHFTSVTEEDESNETKIRQQNEDLTNMSKE